MKEGECVVVAIFPVLGETATAIEPAYGALDDPTLRFDDEAFCVIATFDNVDCQGRHDAGNAIEEDRPGIGAIREQLAEERELSEQGGQQQDAAVAVLNVSGGHQRMQHQTERIDQDMALLALDQLAGVEAMRIDRRPPFSALFTLWLSTMQAVGLASRSASPRHFTYRA